MLKSETSECTRSVSKGRTLHSRHGGTQRHPKLKLVTVGNTRCAVYEMQESTATHGRGRQYEKNASFISLHFQRRDPIPHMIFSRRMRRRHRRHPRGRVRGSKSHPPSRLKPPTQKSGHFLYFLDKGTNR